MRNTPALALALTVAATACLGCRTISTTMPNGTQLQATSLMTDLAINHVAFPTTRPTRDDPAGAPFTLDGYVSRSDMNGADVATIAATMAKAIAAAATQPQPQPQILLLPTPRPTPRKARPAQPAEPTPRKPQTAAPAPNPNPASANPDVSVLFSPKGGAEAAMLKAIAAATTSVQLMDYTFNSPTLAKALIAAHKRGVAVEGILDDSQRPPATQPTTKPAKPNAVQAMLDAGVRVRFDKHEAIMHNKWMVVDATTTKPVLFTGSKNMTVAGDQLNAENQLEIRGATAKRLTPAYLRDYALHKAHSTP